MAKRRRPWFVYDDEKVTESIYFGRIKAMKELLKIDSGFLQHAVIKHGKRFTIVWNTNHGK